MQYFVFKCIGVLGSYEEIEQSFVELNQILAKIPGVEFLYRSLSLNQQQRQPR